MLVTPPSQNNKKSNRFRKKLLRLRLTGICSMKQLIYLHLSKQFSLIPSRRTSIKPNPRRFMPRNSERRILQRKSRLPEIEHYNTKPLKISY